MKRGYKFRIYPSEENKRHFDVSFAANRWWWNYMLDKSNKVYEEQKEKGEKADRPSARYKLARELPHLKKDEETSWIKEADSSSFIYTADALDSAFKKFFKKQGGYPKFKRKGYGDSFTIQVKGGINPIKHTRYGSFIKIGKCGYVPINLHRRIYGVAKAITVSRKSYDFYEVSILLDDIYQKEEMREQTVEGTVGIDFGVKKDSNVTLSDGTKYPCVDCSRIDKRVKRLKRMLSRKQWFKNGEKKFSRKYNKEVDVKVPSRNYIKLKNKIAKLEARVANIRSANTHNITSDITKSPSIDTIVIEDLNIKGMVKNHYLANSITNANGGEIRRQLEYKSEWYGKRLIKVDRFFASSQTCSACGYKNKKVKNLGVRKWMCPQCGAVHDRDVNAAINIKNEACHKYEYAKA